MATNENLKWLIGGLDAAAFASLLTIISKDNPPKQMEVAAVLLALAIPVLTMRLVILAYTGRQNRVDANLDVWSFVTVLLSMNLMISTLNKWLGLAFSVVSLGGLLFLGHALWQHRREEAESEG